MKWIFRNATMMVVLLTLLVACNSKKSESSASISPPVGEEDETIPICNEDKNLKDQFKLDFSWPWTLPDKLKIVIDNEIVYNNCDDTGLDYLEKFNLKRFILKLEFENMTLEDHYDVLIYNLGACDSESSFLAIYDFPTNLTTKSKTICDEVIEYRDSDIIFD